MSSLAEQDRIRGLIHQDEVPNPAVSSEVASELGLNTQPGYSMPGIDEDRRYLAG